MRAARCGVPWERVAGWVRKCWSDYVGREAWPHAEQHCFFEAGHLGPMTHAATVNARIERFVTEVERRRAGERHQSAAMLLARQPTQLVLA